MSARHSFMLVTHGCKVSQYESQALREAWLDRGFMEVARAGEAAFVCLSTCAVTAGAVANARAAVRRINRENPGAAIIVTGCAAEMMEESFRRLPGVVLVVGQRDKERLLHPSAESLAICEGPVTRDGVASAGELADQALPYPTFSVTGYDRSRAVLKVQDGCSHRCTYCIVPLARGPGRSRPPQATLAEAHRLLEGGFREIVLNGINLAQYGRDFGQPHDFWDLVAMLDRELAPRWAGRARIRLSSLEPGQLGPKALDVLGASLLVAPHLHISLQSGSRDVLRRMGRGHYDPDLRTFCHDLTGVFPRYGLGADILTGFPGETEDDAQVTEALCADLPFTYAHVFPYSRRPGTPAANWKDQVPSAAKKERAARLRAYIAAKGKVFRIGCLSLPEVRVACEAAVDAAGNLLGGVNEFYGECRFLPGTAPGPTRHRSLMASRPVGIDEDTLLVVPAPV